MSTPVRLPPLEAILDAHARQMILSGSEPRVRNMALVESAYARPKNRAAYDDAATLFDITAELAYGLASNHGFVDGNKRAAFAAA